MSTKWKIGDRAWCPWYRASFPYNVGGYSRCVVTSLRPKSGQVVVTVYGREKVVEPFELSARPGWHSWGWHSACRPAL